MGYIIRIELKSVLPVDFSKLHKAMEGSGFEHKILADDGKYYRLPRATYTCQSATHSISDILTLANQAVRETGHQAEIFIAHFLSWTSSGLTEIR